MGRLTKIWVSTLFIVMLAACSPAEPEAIETVEVDQAQQESTTPTTAMLTTSDVEIVPETVSEPEGPAAVEGMIVLQLMENSTEARFIIDEVLRGQPTTVVGKTDNVSGEIRIDPTDISATEVGPITIEAGDLRTDNNFRNGAIKDFILKTGSFPLITFSPTSIEGLPMEVAVGDAFTFTLIGDLTIRDITNSVTFEVNVSVQSDTEIRGSAVTTILRGEYELTIPSVPQVASVSQEVILELDFTATQ